MLKVAAKRHIFKTISWRAIGTIDTILLSWLISGDPMIGLSIGGLEVFSKMLLYYFHERAWYKFNFGIIGDRAEQTKINWPDFDKENGFIEQVAFVQNEEKNIIKRLKIYKAAVDIRDVQYYNAVLTFYNRDKRERRTKILDLLTREDIYQMFDYKLNE